MKKIFVLLILVIGVTVSSSAQVSDPQKSTASLASGLSSYSSFKNGYAPASADPKDGNYYLRKSKNMRTTGLVLLGSGLVLGGVGLIVATSDHGTDWEAQDRADQTAAVLLIGSAATGIASIPFMIIAHAYKSKARALLSNQKTSFNIPGMAEKNVIGLSVSLSLGKK